MTSVATSVNVSSDRVQTFWPSDCTNSGLTIFDLNCLLIPPPNKDYSPQSLNSLYSSLNWDEDWSFGYENSCGIVDRTSSLAIPTDYSSITCADAGVRHALENPLLKERHSTRSIHTPDTEEIYPESPLTHESRIATPTETLADCITVAKHKLATPSESGSEGEAGSCSATAKVSDSPRLRTIRRGSGVNAAPTDTGIRAAGQRKNHNRVEKRYRGRLNLEFEMLLAALPAELCADMLRTSGDEPVNRPSKAQVLQLARRHIADLERRQKEAAADKAILLKSYAALAPVQNINDNGEEGNDALRCNRVVGTEKRSRI